MPNPKLFTEAQLKALTRFLSQNSPSQLAGANLDDPEQASSLEWSGLKYSKKKLLPVLKAYQRIAKIMPYEDDKLVQYFLRQGLHSSLQVAAIPRAEFVDTYLQYFGGNREMAERFHANAETIKNQVLLKFMEAKQSQEPHVSQTKLADRL